ncbi:MAG: ATP-binding protein, partial [Candidatus Omnitrophica bacterium]|nr:ATP-binding protein [Candidatus Omnitrophota bacterium]
NERVLIHFRGIVPEGSNPGQFTEELLTPILNPDWTRVIIKHRTPSRYAKLGITAKSVQDFISSHRIREIPEITVFPQSPTVTVVLNSLGILEVYSSPGVHSEYRATKSLQPGTYCFMPISRQMRDGGSSPASKKSNRTGILTPGVKMGADTGRGKGDSGHLTPVAGNTVPDADQAEAVESGSPRGKDKEEPVPNLKKEVLVSRVTTVRRANIILDYGFYLPAVDFSLSMWSYGGDLCIEDGSCRKSLAYEEWEQWVDQQTQGKEGEKIVLAFRIPQSWILNPEHPTTIVLSENAKTDSLPWELFHTLIREGIKSQGVGYKYLAFKLGDLLRRGKLGHIPVSCIDVEKTIEFNSVIYGERFLNLPIGLKLNSMRKRDLSKTKPESPPAKQPAIPKKPGNRPPTGRHNYMPEEEESNVTPNGEGFAGMKGGEKRLPKREEPFEKPDEKIELSPNTRWKNCLFNLERCKDEFEKFCLNPEAVNIWRLRASIEALEREDREAFDRFANGTDFTMHDDGKGSKYMSVSPLHGLLTNSYDSSYAPVYELWEPLHTFDDGSLLTANEDLSLKVLEYSAQHELIAHGTANKPGSFIRKLYMCSHHWALLNIIIQGELSRGDAGILDTNKYAGLKPAYYGPYYIIFKNDTPFNRLWNGDSLGYMIPEEYHAIYLVPNDKAKLFLQKGLEEAVKFSFVTRDKAEKRFAKVMTYAEFLDNPQKVELMVTPASVRGETGEEAKLFQGKAAAEQKATNEEPATDKGREEVHDPQSTIHRRSTEDDEAREASRQNALNIINELLRMLHKPIFDSIFREIEYRKKGFVEQLFSAREKLRMREGGATHILAYLHVSFTCAIERLNKRLDNTENAVKISPFRQEALRGFWNEMIDKYWELMSEAARAEKKDLFRAIDLAAPSRIAFPDSRRYLIPPADGPNILPDEDGLANPTGGERRLPEQREPSGKPDEKTEPSSLSWKTAGTSWKSLLVTPLAEPKEPQGPHKFTPEWLNLEAENFEINGIDLKEFTRDREVVILGFTAEEFGMIYKLCPGASAYHLVNDVLQIVSAETEMIWNDYPEEIKKRIKVYNIDAENIYKYIPPGSASFVRASGIFYGIRGNENKNRKMLRVIKDVTAPQGLIVIRYSMSSESGYDEREHRLLSKELEKEKPVMLNSHFPYIIFINPRKMGQTPFFDRKESFDNGGSSSSSPDSFDNGGNLSRPEEPFITPYWERLLKVKKKIQQTYPDWRYEIELLDEALHSKDPEDLFISVGLSWRAIRYRELNPIDITRDHERLKAPLAAVFTEIGHRLDGGLGQYHEDADRRMACVVIHRLETLLSEKGEFEKEYKDFLDVLSSMRYAFDRNRSDFMNLQIVVSNPIWITYDEFCTKFFGYYLDPLSQLEQMAGSQRNKNDRILQEIRTADFLAILKTAAEALTFDMEFDWRNSSVYLQIVRAKIGHVCREATELDTKKKIKSLETDLEPYLLPLDMQSFKKINPRMLSMIKARIQDILFKPLAESHIERLNEAFEFIEHAELIIVSYEDENGQSTEFYGVFPPIMPIIEALWKAAVKVFHYLRLALRQAEYRDKEALSKNRDNKKGGSDFFLASSPVDNGGSPGSNSEHRVSKIDNRTPCLAGRQVRAEGNVNLVRDSVYSCIKDALLLRNRRDKNSCLFVSGIPLSEQRKTAEAFIDRFENDPELRNEYGDIREKSVFIDLEELTSELVSKSEEDKSKETYSLAKKITKWIEEDKIIFIYGHTDDAHLYMYSCIEPYCPYEGDVPHRVIIFAEKKPSCNLAEAKNCIVQDAMSFFGKFMFVHANGDKVSEYHLAGKRQKLYKSGIIFTHHDPVEIPGYMQDSAGRKIPAVREKSGSVTELVGKEELNLDALSKFCYERGTDEGAFGKLRKKLKENSQHLLNGLLTAYFELFAKCLLELRDCRVCSWRDTDVAAALSDRISDGDEVNKWDVIRIRDGLLKPTLVNIRMCKDLDNIIEKLRNAGVAGVDDFYLSVERIIRCLCEHFSYGISYHPEGVWTMVYESDDYYYAIMSRSISVADVTSLMEYPGLEEESLNLFRNYSFRTPLNAFALGDIWYDVYHNPEPIIYTSSYSYCPKEMAVKRFTEERQAIQRRLTYYHAYGHIRPQIEAETLKDPESVLPVNPTDSEVFQKAAGFLNLDETDTFIDFGGGSGDFLVFLRNNNILPEKYLVVDYSLPRVSKTGLRNMRVMLADIRDPAERRQIEYYFFKQFYEQTINKGTLINVNYYLTEKELDDFFDWIRRYMNSDGRFVFSFYKPHQIEINKGLVVVGADYDACGEYIVLAQEAAGKKTVIKKEAVLQKLSIKGWRCLELASDEHQVVIGITKAISPGAISPNSLDNGGQTEPENISYFISQYISNLYSLGQIIPHMLVEHFTSSGRLDMAHDNIGIKTYYSNAPPNTLLNRNIFVLMVSILYHLYQNAWKYQKEYDDQPVITITIEYNPNKKLILKVKDKGIGIPADELAQVRKMNRYRASNAQKAYSYGVGGRGLWEVGFLVSYLLGKVTIDSEEGVGTEVTVTLPDIVSPMASPVRDTESNESATSDGSSSLSLDNGGSSPAHDMRYTKYGIRNNASSPESLDNGSRSEYFGNAQSNRRCPAGVLKEEMIIAISALKTQKDICDYIRNKIRPDFDSIEKLNPSEAIETLEALFNPDLVKLILKKCSESSYAFSDASNIYMDIAFIIRSIIRLECMAPKSGEVAALAEKFMLEITAGLEPVEILAFYGVISSLTSAGLKHNEAENKVARQIFSNSDIQNTTYEGFLKVFNPHIMHSYSLEFVALLDFMLDENRGGEYLGKIRQWAPNIADRMKKYGEARYYLNSFYHAGMLVRLFRANPSSFNDPDLLNLFVNGSLTKINGLNGGMDDLGGDHWHNLQALAEALEAQGLSIAIDVYSPFKGLEDKLEAFAEWAKPAYSIVSPQEGGLYEGLMRRFIARVRLGSYDNGGSSPAHDMRYTKYGIRNNACPERAVASRRASSPSLDNGGSSPDSLDNGSEDVSPEDEVISSSGEGYSLTRRAMMVRSGVLPLVNYMLGSIGLSKVAINRALAAVAPLGGKVVINLPPLFHSIKFWAYYDLLNKELEDYICSQPEGHFDYLDGRALGDPMCLTTHVLFGQWMRTVWLQQRKELLSLHREIVDEAVRQIKNEDEDYLSFINQILDYDEETEREAQGDSFIGGLSDISRARNEYDWEVRRGPIEGAANLQNQFIWRQLELKLKSHVLKLMQPMAKQVHGLFEDALHLTNAECQSFSERSVHDKGITPDKIRKISQQRKQTSELEKQIKNLYSQIVNSNKISVLRSEWWQFTEGDFIFRQIDCLRERKQASLDNGDSTSSPIPLPEKEVFNLGWVMTHRNWHNHPALPTRMVNDCLKLTPELRRYIKSVADNFFTATTLRKSSMSLALRFDFDEESNSLICVPYNSEILPGRRDFFILYLSFLKKEDFDNVKKIEEIIRNLTSSEILGILFITNEYRGVLYDSRAIVRHRLDFPLWWLGEERNQLETDKESLDNGGSSPAHDMRYTKYGIRNNASSPSGYSEGSFPSPIPRKAHSKQYSTEKMSFLDRYPRQWEWVHLNFLPRMIEKVKETGKREIRILILGISTGEEAARSFHESITGLKELSENPDSWKIWIDAVDWDEEVLEEAERRCRAESSFVYNSSCMYAEEVMATLSRYHEKFQQALSFEMRDIYNPDLFNRASPNLVLANTVLHQLEDSDKTNQFLSHLDGEWKRAWILSTYPGLAQSCKKFHRIERIDMGQFYAPDEEAGTVFYFGVPIGSSRASSPGSKSHRLQVTGHKSPHASLSAPVVSLFFEMDRRYFSKLTDSERVNFSLNFPHGLLGQIDKFAFVRHVDEPVNDSATPDGITTDHDYLNVAVKDSTNGLPVERMVMEILGNAKGGICRAMGEFIPGQICWSLDEFILPDQAVLKVSIIQSASTDGDWRRLQGNAERVREEGIHFLLNTHNDREWGWHFDGKGSGLRKFALVAQRHGVLLRFYRSDFSSHPMKTELFIQLRKIRPYNMMFERIFREEGDQMINGVSSPSLDNGGSSPANPEKFGNWSPNRKRYYVLSEDCPSPLADKDEVADTTERGPTKKGQGDDADEGCENEDLKERESARSLTIKFLTSEKVTEIDTGLDLLDHLKDR